MTVINSKGSAIIAVLLVLLVLTILGLTLFNIDLVHIKILSSDNLYQAAYYYAEAGLIQQTEALLANMEKLYDDPSVISRQSFLVKMLATPINPPQFDDYRGEKVRINITCKKNNAILVKDELILVSTCSIGNVKRAIKATVHVLWQNPSDQDFMLDHTNFSIVGWEETR